MPEKNVKVKIIRTLFNTQGIDTQDSTLENAINSWLATNGVREQSILDIKHTVSELKGIAGFVDTMVILYKQ